MVERDNKIVFTILNVISKYVYYYRRNISSIDIYMYVLYILYGYHKQYTLVDDDSGSFSFDNNNDDLLKDLQNRVRQGTTSYHIIDFYNDLSRIDYNEFERVYSLIIAGILDKISSDSTLSGEFYSPTSITELISYYINSNKCKSVFDPFCGTATIVHFLEDQNTSFCGQDIVQDTALIARLNMDAHYGVSSGITLVDSILKWNSEKFDAVVSCPPFNYDFSVYQQEALFGKTDNFQNNLEELFFSRSFNMNKARLVIALEPLSFCVSPRFYRLREYLVEKNHLDTIIILPERLLYGTSIPCALIVCKTEREKDDKIKFINAETFIEGSARSRIFVARDLIRAIDTKINTISVNVSVEQVKKYNYNLNHSLYDYQLVELKDGQHLEKLGSLISNAKSTLRLAMPLGAHNIYPRTSLKTECIDIWRAHDNVLLPKPDGIPVKNVVYHSDTVTNYLLYSSVNESKTRFGLYTGSGDLMCHHGIRVMHINDKLVVPEYLIYILTNHPVIKRGFLPLEEFLNLPVVVDSIDNQKNIVAKIKQQYAIRTREEQEADAKRLGVKQNVSDLEHMLGTPESHVDSIIYDLERTTPDALDYLSKVKSLKDNFEYIKRIISFSNSEINDDMFNLRKLDIINFIKNYCNAWKNYSGNYFELSLKNYLGDSLMANFNKTLLKVALDAILTNAEKHGFNKHKKEFNQAEISLTLERYENKPFLVIRVSNNGAPFKDGFTLEDYITRGRYSANSGRSGLGGYHVYKIAKGHQGYVYIDSNKIWNVIVEILLPIDNVEPQNLVDYEHECI